MIAPKNLAREYALHFTNSGTCGASKRSSSFNQVHPHIVKETTSSGAVVAPVMLNGNGNGHSSFGEEEKPRSHPRGFFADQFEVSPSHSGRVGTWLGTPSAEPQQLRCAFHRHRS
jgi:hypothetical protein